MYLGHITFSKNIYKHTWKNYNQIPLSQTTALAQVTPGGIADWSQACKALACVWPPHRRSDPPHQHGSTL